MSPAGSRLAGVADRYAAEIGRMRRALRERYFDQARSSPLLVVYAMFGQRLSLERRLVQHDLPDRLVHDFLEARHVRALLVGTEVNDAFEPG